jgi:hypothetical protein
MFMGFMRQHWKTSITSDDYDEVMELEDDVMPEPIEAEPAGDLDVEFDGVSLADIGPEPAEVPLADEPIAPEPAGVPLEDEPVAPEPAEVPLADEPIAPEPAGVPLEDEPIAPEPAGVPLADEPIAPELAPPEPVIEFEESQLYMRLDSKPYLELLESISEVSCRSTAGSESQANDRTQPTVFQSCGSNDKPLPKVFWRLPDLLEQRKAKLERIAQLKIFGENMIGYLAVYYSRCWF